MTKIEGRIHSYLAEFKNEDDFLQACQQVQANGFSKWEAYSPFPIHEVDHIMGLDKKLNSVAVVGLIGGLLGLTGGFILQYSGMNFIYPINVGGRVGLPWPGFIPIMFELTVLISSLSMIVFMLIRSDLFRPHHPLFNLPDFRRATKDSFFIGIESTDPFFNLERTKAFLQGLRPVNVFEVPHE